MRCLYNIDKAKGVTEFIQEYIIDKRKALIKGVSNKRNLFEIQVYASETDYRLSIMLKRNNEYSNWKYYVYVPSQENITEFSNQKDFFECIKNLI